MKKRFKRKPYIRYSNVYEEINSLLSVASGKTYLSVCSGFDNTLALLLNNPEKIVSFDYNETQIYLAKLKLAAFKFLTYQEMLLFFGINSTKKIRLILYDKIYNYLDSDVQEYFNKNIDIIKDGLIYAGKFEYYLSKFKQFVLPFTSSKKFVIKFMNASSLAEQRLLYKKFNNRRLNILFKIFFSKKVMSYLGRDKDYFKEIKVDLASNLKLRVDKGFNNVLNINNPYMQYIFLGKFISLPEYLKEENFEHIKTNLDKIELHICDFKDALKMNKYDFLNLSDIFEYMSEEETSYCEKLIIDNTNTDATIVFWNMMVERKFSSDHFEEIDSEKALLEERPFFYQALRRYKKI